MKEIEALSNQEYSVLSLYLGLNSLGITLTKSEIAKLYGISVARVTTIISKGYQKLATPSFYHLLKNEQ